MLLVGGLFLILGQSMRVASAAAAVAACTVAGTVAGADERGSWGSGGGAHGGRDGGSGGRERQLGGGLKLILIDARLISN
jgi:hypothetical protein